MVYVRTVKVIVGVAVKGGWRKEISGRSGILSIQYAGAIIFTWWDIQ